MNRIINGNRHINNDNDILTQRSKEKLQSKYKHILTE